MLDTVMAQSDVELDIAERSKVCAVYFIPMMQKCREEARGSKVTSSFEMWSESLINKGSMQYACRDNTEYQIQEQKININKVQ